MFFIDDQEPQILEDNSFRENPMRCDYAIEGSIRESLQYPSRFFLGTESCQNSETDSKMSQTFLERFHVFICENHERRDQYRLLSIEKSPIDSIHSHFCFSKSHISGEQTIHGVARLHICEDFSNSALLINGMLIGEVFSEKLFLLSKSGE